MLPVHAAAHPVAGGARRPRPVAGVPAQRQRAEAAARHRRGADLAGVLGAGGLRQARAEGRPAAQRAAGRAVVPVDAGRLLPGADPRPVRRPAGQPPAAPRDHHQLGGQLDGQPGRHHVRLPRGGGDRRHPRAGRPRVRGLPRGLRPDAPTSPRSRRSTTSSPPTPRPRSTWSSAGCWTARSGGSCRTARRPWTSAPRSSGSVAVVAEHGPQMLSLLQGEERQRLERRIAELEAAGAPSRDRDPGGRAARPVLAAGRGRDLRRDRPRRQRGRAGLLRDLRAVRHRRDADAGDPAAARRPLGRPGPWRAARRPLRGPGVADHVGPRGQRPAARPRPSGSRSGRRPTPSR